MQPYQEIERFEVFQDELSLRELSFVENTETVQKSCE